MKHDSKFGQCLKNRHQNLDRKLAAKKNKEVKNKGKYTRDFEKFWKEYPRKIQKEVAFRVWRKIDFDSEVTSESIISSVKDSLEHEWRGRSKEWLPYPSKFLSTNKWENDCSEDPNFRKSK